MNRRTFLKLVGISGAATLTAPLAFGSSVQKFPDGATPDEVNEFLFSRGLRPCPHSHHSTDKDFAECTGRYDCDCGLVQYVRQPEGHFAATHIRVNGQLQRFDYRLHCWHQNLHRKNAGLPLPKSAEDRFNESLYKRLLEKNKQGYEMDFLLIDPPTNFHNTRYRYVRFWVKGQKEPFVWYHPYPH